MPIASIAVMLAPAGVSPSATAIDPLLRARPSTALLLLVALRLTLGLLPGQRFAKYRGGRIDLERVAAVPVAFFTGEPRRKIERGIIDELELFTGVLPHMLGMEKHNDKASAVEAAKLVPPSYVDIPEMVANVAFGGTKLNRLFICGTTSLYSIYLTTNGSKLG